MFDILAIIPARGGSKGLPRKNLLPFCGQPLIAHTIKAALEAKGISRVVVSTDDLEIAAVAREFGAEVPFLRPADLATDDSAAIDAYLYTVEELRKHEGKNSLGDSFVVLLPTSPLRVAQHIDESISVFIGEAADSVISVTEAPVPLEWYKWIDHSGRLLPLEVGSQAKSNLNRQAYGKLYVPNGAIYIFRYNLLKSSRAYYYKDTFPYIMQQGESVDIDTYDDFFYAEWLKGRHR